MTSTDLPEQDNLQTSAAPMFSHSQLRDISQGSFYHINGDAHIHFATREYGLDYLQQFIASGALHDAAERFPQPRCHEFTRLRIIEKIIRWVAQDFSTRILWLRGSAGVGKSAICQTIAEMCKVKSCLAAAFFFSRSSLERNTDKHLIATIAYQMALAVPGLKSLISEAVEEDRSIITKDINSQVSRLIIQPLIQATRKSPLTSRFLIIIDGLDECVDEKEQSKVLSAIGDALTKHDIPLCFLVASRPEHQISFRFKKNDLHSITSHLVIDEDDETKPDIKAFFKSEFSRIRHEHSIPDFPQWPKEGVVDDLADRASGQFIYASTVIKFVDDPHGQPQNRLNVVLGISPSGSFSPFAEIDALYTQILSNVSNIDAALLCFGLLCFAHPYNVIYHYPSTDRRLFQLEHFDQLLFPESGEAHLIFAELHCIVDIHASDGEGGQVIRIRHKSLIDFLVDKSRSGNYFIDKNVIGVQITRLLMAFLRNWVTNLELDYFQLVVQRGGSSLPELPRWVTRSWVDRLCSIRGEVQKDILDELSGIADAVMKKSFDVTEVLQVCPTLKFWRLDAYTTILSWMNRQELHSANPILYNAYCTLFDKAVISRLEPFSSLGPRHFLHVSILFNISFETGSGDRALHNVLHALAYFTNPKIFDDFFTDPKRSGKFCLSAEDHADIAASYFRYVAYSNVNGFCQQLGINEDEGRQVIFGPSWYRPNQAVDTLQLHLAVAKHLSNASTSNAELIDALCRCYPDTLPNYYYTPGYHLAEGKQVLNKAMTRYLLNNSQEYEHLITREKNLAADLEWKKISIPLGLGVAYFILVAYIFYFREVYKMSGCYIISSLNQICG